MQRLGSIVKQINRRNKMELETFECSHKIAYPSRDGGGKYSIYVTKDDGTDMTVYGEAIGAEGWQKGAKLRIQAEPARQSKNGKWYQTAKSVELVDGEAVVIPTVRPTAAKDVGSQWKEKYRLTMSNLLASYLSNKHGNDIDEDKAFTVCDKLVRQILDAKYDGDESPF
jgi:hypothetical protein